MIRLAVCIGISVAAASFTFTVALLTT